MKNEIEADFNDYNLKMEKASNEVKSLKSKYEQYER
jgi:hypothetical protein